MAEQAPTAPAAAAGGALPAEAGRAAVAVLHAAVPPATAVAAAAAASSQGLPDGLNSSSKADRAGSTLHTRRQQQIRQEQRHYTGCTRASVATEPDIVGSWL